MSSILTNNGAMVALQTLKGINANMAKTQSEISTGKSVATAKDNAAVWAISKVMESDVEGFKGISDSLSLGSSTVAVARQASETVTNLLTQMKGKIVAAQESNVDRAKIQTDITALKDQIASVVGAAQFSGLNLLSNSSSTAGSGSVKILSSLDRSSGGVTASDISVGKRDLTMKASSLTGTGTHNAGTGAGVGTTTVGATGTGTLSVSGTVAAGNVYSIGLTGAGTYTGATYNTATTMAGAQNIMYIARDGDTTADVAKGLSQAFAMYAADNGVSSSTLSMTVSGSSLSLTTTLANTLTARVDTVTGATVTIGGGLEKINSFNVTTDTGADSALVAVEYMIQNSVDAAARFGSAQSRIETQSDFISGLTNALKSGIGTLVDANMEETSARLQALQVQQQLGVQSLSIANQAPQSILSLFR